jgi:hypothetical protein
MDAVGSEKVGDWFGGLRESAGGVKQDQEAVRFRTVHDGGLSSFRTQALNNERSI